MRRNPSLRTRLILTFSLVATLIVLAVSVTTYVAVSSQLVDVVDAALEDRLVDLANDVESGQFDAIASDDRLTQVLDADGTVLVSSTAVPDTIRLFNLNERTVLEQSNLRISESQTIGALKSDIRVRARLVDGPDGPLILVAARSMAAVDSNRRQILLGLALGTPLIASTVIALGWILTRRILRPVQRMAQEAASRSTSVGSGRPLGTVSGQDEFSELALALNELLERIEISREHERRFIADVSHELRTPLAVIRGELELANLDVAADSEIAASLESAIEESDRMTNLIDRLLFIARADAGQMPLRITPTSVPGILDALVESLPRSPEQEHLILKHTAPAQLVEIDPDIITQILINLLTNALRYARSEVRIEATVHGGYLTLRVDDDGDGFSSGHLISTFDRFKPQPSRIRSISASTQFGLGLSIVGALASASAGSASATNGALGGGSVEVCLPAKFVEPAIQ